jgi:hypothetical protein
MPALTHEEIRDLKTKFLTQVLKLSKEELKLEVNASKAWDEMRMGAFNKELVMPYIISELIHEGKIEKGDNPEDIILVKRPAETLKIHLLEILNNVINEDTGNSTIGITLNVHGVTITGFLVSIRNYYDDMYQEIIRSNPIAQSFKVLFDELKKEIPYNAEQWDLVKEITGLGYVCLKNAKYVYGTSMLPTNDRGLWMGKIDSVDGFMLGTIEEFV